MNEHIGKFRGRVENNIDPMMLGRIQVSVPDVLGDARFAWAVPCVPYAGDGVGLFAIPPIGSHVWVEFEGGDAERPIWVGCFWGSPAEVPAITATVPPGVNGVSIQTQGGHVLTISDTPGPTGGILLRTTGGSMISVSEVGITITNGSDNVIVGNGTALGNFAVPGNTVNQDLLFSASAAQINAGGTLEMVINGQAGMQIMGDWAKGEWLNAGKVPGQDVLCFRYPGTQGAVTFNSDAFGMMQVSEDKQDAQFKLAAAIMDPAFQESFNLKKGSIPARNDVPDTNFDACGKKAIADAKEATASDTLMGSMAHGHAASEAVKGAVYDTVTKFFNSDMSSADAAKELQSAVANAK